MHFNEVESLLQTKCPFHLGFSRWISIEQEEVDVFARLTGDLQRIHIDPKWAYTDGPFSMPIIHGAFLLALVPVIVGELVVVESCNYIVNIGMDRVRFKSPAPVGSRLQGEGVLREVMQISRGIVIVARVTIRTEETNQPVCLADQKMMFC
jgi:Acyl dehydratase